MHPEHDPRPSPLAALIDAAAEWSVLVAGIAVSVAGGIAEARHAVADGFDLESLIDAAVRFVTGA